MQLSLRPIPSYVRIRRVARLRNLGPIAVVGLFLLLPLYEFIDIGEQWPFDGQLVSVMLCCLFIVAALLACRTWRCVWHALTRLARYRVAFADVPSMNPQKPLDITAAS